MRRVGVAAPDGVSSRVPAVYVMPPRNAFAAALKDVKEVWEMPWDDRPVYAGLVHSRQPVMEDEGAVIVLDAQSFEEIKRLPMRKPIGKYNVWNKINYSSGTSH